MKKTLNVLFFLLGTVALNMNWAQSNALNFDGIEDYVQWGDPEQGFPGPYAVTPMVEPLVGADFTIELWMKSDFTLWPGPHGLLWAFNSYNPNHASNRLILGINTSGRLYIHDGLNNGLSVLRWTGSTDVTDGECHHVAFTHNFTTKETNVYVDGVIEGGGITTTFILGETDLFSLGQEWDNLDGEHPTEPHEPSQFYYGDMDDVHIWTEEREIDEIADNLYTNFTAGEPNLLAVFDFDQGVGGDDNTSISLLENGTLTPDLDGDLVNFERLGATSNFVIDECAPCFEDVIVGEDQEICEGEEVTLTAAGGGIGVTYEWTGGVVDDEAFIPDITTTYTLTGTGPDGCETMDSVTILVNPLPTIEAGSDTTLCEGGEIALLGTGGMTYTWTGGVIDGEPFTPIATELYTVIGTDINGCENTDEVTVTINPLPTVDAGSDIAVCEGEMITLAASGTGGVIYTWTGGVIDGEPFSPVETESYIVLGTDANGCENTDEVTVTVNPLPIFDAGPDVIICEGEAITLEASGFGLTYTWTGGVVDGVPFTPDDTELYTVTGTDINGCENTDGVMVTVHELPPVNAGLDVVICEGEEVTLSETEEGIGVTYTWTDGVVDGMAFSPDMTTTYSVTGVDVNGCENTDEVTVTVNPPPTVDAGPDISICEGEMVTLIGSGSGVTYEWADGIVDGESFSPTTTGVYTVVGSDAIGCENTDSVLVTVNPIPNVFFYGDDLIGCVPHSVNFTTDTPGATFSWQFGDGNVSNVEDPSHVYMTEGTFDVTLTVTSSDGCSGTATYFDYITVVPQPVADFTFTTNDANEGELSVQFENHSLYSDTYSWNFGDGSPTSDVENPFHVFPGVNELGYQVELKAFNSLGCRDSVIKLLKIQDYLIYYVPNAFTPDGDSYNDFFQPVFTSGFDIYSFHMMIFNRWGELIFESYNSSYGWDGTYGDNGLVQDGTYVWVIEFREASTDKRYFEEGHVNVLK